MEEVVGYVYVVNFVSGFIWIFQLLLFAYLYYEHQLREKFPQNLILLLLFADTAFRCIWFFLYNDYRSTMYAILFNRTAMLLQFTAITVLMLMWLRALQITQITYALSHRHLDAPTPLPDPDDAILDASDEEKSAKTAVQTPSRALNRNPLKNKKAQATSAVQGKVLDEVSIRAEAERKQKLRLRVAIFVNVCTWCFILGSCAARDETWYSANLIMISFLCSAEAVITLTIGVRTSLMLHKELMPVFQTTNTNLAQSRVRQRQSGSLCRLLEGCGCSDLYRLYQLFFSPSESALGLQLQRDVLKTLLNVSLIVFVFFFIRSFAFVYKPAAEELAHGNGYDIEVGDALYPLFYYQFPESLPNLAIALGISPPNSVLRRAMRWVKINIFRNSALRFVSSSVRRSGGDSDTSHGPGSSASGRNNGSHSNAVRDTVVIRHSELADTFSLFLTVDRATLAALALSANNSEPGSRPQSQGRGQGGTSEEGDERNSRRVASARASSRSSGRIPSNFKRNSNPLTSERVTLSTLQEERAEDLSSSVDLEGGGVAPLAEVLKAHVNDLNTEDKNEEEVPIDPLERNTDDSYTLNVSVSESKPDDGRSSQRESVRASFNISKPIPINRLSSSQKRKSRRGGAGNSQSDDDDSYLYDEESVNSTDVSSSLPSVMQTGSSRYSSSAPRSLPTAGSSYPDVDSTGTSIQSLTRAQQSALQYMSQSPPGLLKSLRHLSRERSIDPTTNRDYLEVLYRLDSVGSYNSAGSYLSGEYEVNPMFRHRAKTTDSSVGLAQSPAASASISAPRASESNAAKWNWYSQFW